MTHVCHVALTCSSSPRLVAGLGVSHLQSFPPTDQTLKENDNPLVVQSDWKKTKTVGHFVLRRRTDGMIRVFARLPEDAAETFHSVIVSPTATTRSVIDIMVSKYFTNWDPRTLDLVEVTPKAGEHVHS